MTEESNSEQLQEPLLPTQDEESNSLTRAEEVPSADGNQEDEPKSRNIPLTLWYQAIRCGGEAIWLGSVLAAYVYLLRPENPETIGYLSALEGIVQFCAACAAGVLGDLYRRDTLLKVSSGIGITASLLIVASCIDRRFFVGLAMALALNGAFDGIGLTASLAIFADSIKDGDRSYYFTQRSLCTNGGQFFGPIAGLIFFYLLGDEWTVANCARVIGGAQLVLAPAFVMLCFFRDEQPRSSSTDNSDTEEERQPSDPAEESPREEESALLYNNPPSSQSPFEEPYLWGLSKPRIIAISAALSDITCAVASGISLRYFTIFQLDSLKLSPVVVNVLDALSCLFGGGLMMGAQRLSTYWGRCRVSILFKAMGVAFLLIMIQSYKQGRHPEELLLGSTTTTNNISSGTRVFVCIAYLLQNAFLGSTSAITQSLMIDHVPSQERARWSALESINIFGWCGSAAIGGILVAHFGSVLPVFFITACLQVVGSLPLVALIVFGNEGLEQELAED